ncbi:MAG TPA: cytochrome c [Acidimicrobiia bacterium]|jgi:cytochrome c551
MRRALLVACTAVLAAGCLGRPAPDATGQDIYLQLCANCHGTDLEGRVGPPLGSGSNSAVQPDEFLHVAIVDGRGRMPSFSTSLTSEQVDRLIAYLREVQGA